MARIGYFRVSTSGQSVDAQRAALGGSFHKEFIDEGVSGATLAADRPGFSKMLAYLRENEDDEVHVYAIDRLGRDAVDVQATVRRLIDAGIVVHVHGLGPIGRGVGELVVAVLAQMASMERDRITHRCQAGKALARETFQRTGRTHRGKTKLGRGPKLDAAAVRQWREENKASIAATAAHFEIGTATVKRYMR